MRGKESWKVTVLLLPAGELGWESLPGSPGKHQAFPRQWEGWGEVLSVQEIGKMWTTLLAQGVWRGGLLLALGTAFTGSRAKSGVWGGSSSAFGDTVEPTFLGGVSKWRCLILWPSICLPPQATA